MSSLLSPCSRLPATHRQLPRRCSSWMRAARPSRPASASACSTTPITLSLPATRTRGPTSPRCGCALCCVSTAFTFSCTCTQRWNQDDRWLPLSLKRPCSVLYVGGNTDGADGKQLRDTYGCHIHTFEPVTPFFESLQRLFGQDREGYSLYAYGWANSDRSIEVDALAGQSTTLTEGADKLKGSTGTEKSAPVAGGGKLTLQLRDAVKIVEELMPGTGPIDLLHMNCEGAALGSRVHCVPCVAPFDSCVEPCVIDRALAGCEFEALERLLDAGVISRFNVIQFGSHFEVSRVFGCKALFVHAWTLLYRAAIGCVVVIAQSLLLLLFVAKLGAFLRSRTCKGCRRASVASRSFCARRTAWTLACRLPGNGGPSSEQRCALELSKLCAPWARSEQAMRGDAVVDTQTATNRCRRELSSTGSVESECTVMNL